jgi:uracil-DNA glycosylase
MFEVNNLFKWFDKKNVKKYLHKTVVDELNTHKDEKIRKTMLTKVSSYDMLPSFSVEKDVVLPPSLKNIYKEIEAEFGYQMPKDNGNLSSWAKQGVLLLNSVLTVQKGLANSHKGKGWEQFTMQIVKELNKREKPLVFLLWGNGAKNVGAVVDKNKHFVLSCAHPSPLSAYNGFFGCNHFKKANEILESLGDEPINWKIN